MIKTNRRSLFGMVAGLFATKKAPVKWGGDGNVWIENPAFKSQIQVPSGTAAPPAFSFSNDTDTGAFPDSSGLRFVSDGITKPR